VSSKCKQNYLDKRVSVGISPYIPNNYLGGVKIYEKNTRIFRKNFNTFG
jgi:hypothetical protein